MLPRATPKDSSIDGANIPRAPPLGHSRRARREVTNIAHHQTSTITNIAIAIATGVVKQHFHARQTSTAHHSLSHWLHRPASHETVQKRTRRKIANEEAQINWRLFYQSTHL